MTWIAIKHRWVVFTSCFTFVAVLMSQVVSAEGSCSGKAGDRLKPGTYIIDVCVPVGKCVSSYDQNAYCSKAQDRCTSKSADCEPSSACNALPDGDNKGVTSTVAAGAACTVHEGKKERPGVLCTFSTTVAALGHLDCHCACGQNIPVPSAIADHVDQGLVRFVEQKSCAEEARQKYHRSSRRTEVSFVNDSAEEIQIFGLNSQGTRILYRSLMPHQSYVQKTFTTRPLVVTDKKGECKRLVIAGKASGEVVIK